MKLKKQFETKLSVEEGDRSVVARISTASVDREGDVVLPSGVELDEYNKNPIVLFGHNSGTLPIGTANGMRTTRNAVEARVKFAERPKEHPATAEWVPDTIFSLFQQGVLRAFSVGFMVPEGGIRDADQKDKGRFGDAVRRVITRWQLLEFSVVAIPANSECLSIAVSKGTISEDSWTWGELETDGMVPATVSHKCERLVFDSYPPLEVILS